MIEQALAFFGGGLRGVADGAARMKVLGLPRERRRPMRRKPAIILLHRDAGRAKFGDRIAAHMLLVSRQHDRGLDRAAMDAVAQFFRGKQSLRRAEPRPCGGDGEKSVLRAQFLRHKLMAALLPPWLVTITSFLMPARATLSPSAVQAFSAVSAGSVSVPG